eukprot:749522-Hanusia_phi.AAC.1
MARQGFVVDRKKSSFLFSFSCSTKAGLHEMLLSMSRSSSSDFIMLKRDCWNFTKLDRSSCFLIISSLGFKENLRLASLGGALMGKEATGSKFLI